MRVHPSQLVPGCLIKKDVMGMTNRPIVSKNTVVHPIHIRVLQKFMVGEVETANKLSDGSPFIPEEKLDSPEEIEQVESEPETLTFQDSYLDAVQMYKRWFEDWRGGAPVNIHALRKVMVPLIEKAIESKHAVFQLHHFSSSKDYLYHHSVAMGVISGYLASKMGYSYGEWMQAGLAGVLSDSGMAKIEKRILDKDSPLTESEFEQVKQHATYSYRLVEKIPSLSSSAKIAILQHHERLDGSGYPLGLSQQKLHRFSQIIAVSDMYHAMTSERVYRKKHSPYLVLEEILKEQFGRYDHNVVQVLVKEMTNYSQGTRIRLSTNQLAEVLFVEQAHPTRPLIRFVENGEICALKEQLDLHIEEVVS